MMLKLVVFLAFAAVACAYVCIDLQCVHAGGSCADTATVDKRCSYGTFCDEDANNTCKAYILANANCNISNGDRCVEGYECTVGKCTPNLLGPSYPCTTNAQCFTYSPTGTNASTCVNGKCAFLAVGDACVTFSGASNCGQDAFCNNVNVCQSFLAPGAACNPQEDLCGKGYYCYLSTNTCTKLFTLAPGSNCTALDQCAIGLICSNSQNAIPTAGRTCQTPAIGAASGTPCEYGTCPSVKEECGCAYFDGQNSTCINLKPVPGVTAALDALIACVESKRKCSTSAIFSCSACQREACDYYAQADAAQALIDPCGDVINSPPGKGCSAASSVVVGSAFLVAVAFACIF